MAQQRLSSPAGWSGVVGVAYPPVVTEDHFVFIYLTFTAPNILVAKQVHR
jgi:hypothetical protein